MNPSKKKRLLRKLRAVLTGVPLFLGIAAGTGGYGLVGAFVFGAIFAGIGFLLCDPLVYLIDKIGTSVPANYCARCDQFIKDEGHKYHYDSQIVCSECAKYLGRIDPLNLSKSDE